MGKRINKAIAVTGAMGALAGAPGTVGKVAGEIDKTTIEGGFKGAELVPELIVSAAKFAVEGDPAARADNNHATQQAADQPPVGGAEANHTPVSAVETHEVLPNSPAFYELRPEQSTEISGDSSLTPDKQKYMGDVIIASEILSQEDPHVNLAVMDVQAMVETEWGTKQMMHEVNGQWVPTGNILGIKGADDYTGHQEKFPTKEKDPATGEYYWTKAWFRVYDRFDPTTDPNANIKNMVDCMKDYVREIERNFPEASAHYLEPDVYLADLENGRYQYATAGSDYIDAVNKILEPYRFITLIRRGSRKP